MFQEEFVKYSVPIRVHLCFIRGFNIFNCIRSRRDWMTGQKLLRAHPPPALLLQFKNSQRPRATGDQDAASLAAASTCPGGPEAFRCFWPPRFSRRAAAARLPGA